MKSEFYENRVEVLLHSLAIAYLLSSSKHTSLCPNSDCSIQPLPLSVPWKPAIHAKSFIHGSSGSTLRSPKSKWRGASSS